MGTWRCQASPGVAPAHAPSPERVEDEDLRGFEWYYFDRLCRSELLSIPGYASAFSPASHRIAIQTDNFRSFSVWDLKERKLVQPIHTA